MEYKSLFWGVLMAIGIFAVKGGAGGFYYLTRIDRWTRRAFMLVAMWLAYLALFAAISLVIRHTNLAAWFGLIQGVVPWAMAIHFLMAAGMAAWGLALLRGGHRHQRTSLGWLVLAVPCPVCLVVLFFTLAFLTAYFPDHPFQVAFWAYAGFTGIQTMTMLVLRIWRSQTHTSPESALGGTMIVIAAYFVLSVFIMPGFSELDRIYRLSLPPLEAGAPVSAAIWWLPAGLAVVFAAGFIRKWKGDRFSCK